MVYLAATCRIVGSQPSRPSSGAGGASCGEAEKGGEVCPELGVADIGDGSCERRRRGRHVVVTDQAARVAHQLTDRQLVAVGQQAREAQGRLRSADKARPLPRRHRKRDGPKPLC